MEATLGHKDDGACVQHDTAPEREDDELDNYEGGNLEYDQTTTRI